MRAVKETQGKKLRRVFLRAARFSLLAFFLIAAAPPARAHDDGRPPALRDVAFEQRLGAAAPLDAPLRDESGRAVRLGDYFGARPVIFLLTYYRCQDLCPLVLDGLLRSLRAISYSAGAEFDVLTVSIDPRDTPALAAAKKADFVRRYGRAGAGDGWHFLTGDEAALRRVAEAAGFRYNYESDRDRFGHAAGIMLLTPGGRFARYFYGIEFSPRDLRLGLVEASDGKIGRAIDQLLLFCYHYDAATGKYGLLVTKLVRVASAATVVALAAYILLMLRAEARHKTKLPGSA